MFWLGFVLGFATPVAIAILVELVLALGERRYGRLDGPRPDDS